MFKDDKLSVCELISGIRVANNPKIKATKNTKVTIIAKLYPNFSLRCKKRIIGLAMSVKISETIK
ncbi:hypothetical protein GCM10011508_11440 [Flavobacterium lutivivi]|nr:hypothetical protein GCM10011508_11440 [Flavobacterium lutivivi]